MIRKIWATFLVLLDTFNITIDFINRAGDKSFSEEMKICLDEFNTALKDRFGNDLSISQSKFLFEESRLRHLLRIMPRSTRQEFIADLQPMMEDLENANKGKFYIKIRLFRHFLSTLYHGFIIRVKDYFYPSVKPNDKD